MPRAQAKSFAALLRTTREAQKLTQTELAERSGLTPAAVSQLEAGERLPAFRTMVSIAEALKTSVGYLLGEDDSALPPEMKAMFRDLQNLGSEDISKVRDYAAFLRSQADSTAKK